MSLIRFMASIFSIGHMIFGLGLASGQDYPNKPIRIITNGPGGNNDFIARLIAQGISGPLGQPVVVVDQPSGSIPMETVVKAPPDGYTLLVNGTPLWILPLIRNNVPWDPIKDFSPITLVVNSPNVLVVHPSLPAKSVNELIALAKARPGELNYASVGPGSGAHLAAELFKSLTGVNIVHIPYKTAAQVINDLIGGQVQLTFAVVAAATSHIKSGRLRALAITSAQPSALFPGLPTVAATVPGYEAAGMSGLFAPAKTPEAIISRLNQEAVRFLKTAQAREQLFNNTLEAVGSSPEEFSIKIKSEMTKLGKVIRDADIHEQ